MLPTLTHCKESDAPDSWSEQRDQQRRSMSGSVFLFTRGLPEVLGFTKYPYHLILFNEVWGFMDQTLPFAAHTINLG